MTIIVMESVSEKIRGECTRYLLEIKPGVFLGSITKIVRELLWQQICDSCTDGGAIMAYSASNEQGFNLQIYGNTNYQVIDMDGLKLIQHQ